MIHLLLFFTFLLFGRVEAQPEGECVQTETCLCKYSNDYIVDLRPLDSVESPRFENVPDETDGGRPPHDYMFDVNLCSEFYSPKCGDDVTVCQVSIGGDKRFTIATLKPQFSTVQGKLYYYMTGGEHGKIAQVRLDCDALDEGSMSAQGNSESNEDRYEFTLSSKYACPVLSSGGDNRGSRVSLSPGSILLICAVSLVFVYFIVGALVMKLKMRAKGREVVPQVALWTSIPGLIKEGVLFVCKCGRGTEPPLIESGNTNDSTYGSRSQDTE